MKTIGRSLAFYLKYLEEMEVFYESEDDINEDLLSEVSNRDEFNEMIMQVGERADNQALALLTEAIERVKKTFSTDIACKDIRNRQAYWGISLWLWPKGKKKHNPLKWQTGITFHENYQGRPCFIAWVWAKGGQKAENNLAELLTVGGGVKMS